MTGDPPLSSADRARLDAEICARRDRTRARLAQLDRDLAALVDATHDSPDDEHDPEGATIGFERAQTTALLEEAREHLAALDRAADALAAGRLGSCDRCGRAIGVDRLLARPSTRHCIRCAT